jgi:hypothetical protein
VCVPHRILMPRICARWGGAQWRAGGVRHARVAHSGLLNTRRDGRERVSRSLACVRRPSLSCLGRE